MLGSSAKDVCMEGLIQMLQPPPHDSDKACRGSEHPADGPLKCAAPIPTAGAAARALTAPS
jgi:hypothetical protein